MLTLSWSDGDSLILENSCLFVSSKESKLIGPVKEFDKKTIAVKLRRLTQMKALLAIFTLLDTAVFSCFFANYVLFDTCFAANIPHITAIKGKGTDVFIMIKERNCIKYLCNE